RPPPPPRGPAGRPGGAAGRQACGQQLTSAGAEISPAAIQLSGLSWADVEAAASGAVTTAQGLLGAALRVAAALTGPVDPASLPDLLTDLTMLRVDACPDPVTPADRVLYQQRMTELRPPRAPSDTDVPMRRAPLGGRLPAPAGGRPPSPRPLRPARLNTRTSPAASGGTEFRIRIYVDSVHIDAHDPRLTDDEAQWADH